MEAYKGTYNNGKITLINPAPGIKKSDVIVIFPEYEKKVMKIRGLFKGHKVNYKQIDNELKKLRKKGQQHILLEFKNNDK